MVLGEGGERINPKQTQIVEQLIGDCADELDSGLDSHGGTVVARKLYRLAAAIRVNRRGGGVDIAEFVGRDDEWVMGEGGGTHRG